MRLPVLAACAGLLGFAPGPVAAVAFDLPDIPRCTELTPGAIALDSTPVTLNLRIVLDGATRHQGETAVADARAAYEPLGIALAVSYEQHGFRSSEGSELIDEARAHYGGARPAGIHAVYVLSAKDLYSQDVTGSDPGLVGQADCIGGIAYADRAFAVGEALPDSPLFVFGSRLAGKTLIHELGHLLGAHHHYANCVEAVAALDAPCTVMINDLFLAAPVFSTLNGIVTRGHAQLTQPQPLPDQDDGGALGAWELLLLAGAASAASRRRRQDPRG